MKVLLLGFVLAAVAVELCFAAENSSCCPQCGAAGCWRKTCRLVQDVKKTKEFRYRIECEDVCLPGRSTYGGAYCCINSRCLGFCRSGEPTCCGIINRKKLVKESVTVEKPVCRCVVDYVCTRCGCQRAP